jgi:hypothetical protein
MRNPNQNNRVFGEAVAFYSLRSYEDSKTVVVFRPLADLEQPFRTVIRGKWPLELDEVQVMEVGSVVDIVGIWEAETKYVYVLRKHGSLLALSPIERGVHVVDAMEQVDDLVDDT